MPEWIVKGQLMSDYLHGCKDADIDNFKNDPRLTAIWEHCSTTIANQYLINIKQDNPWLLDKIFTNDIKGGSKIVDFSDFIGSPSTLQYIGVLSNLIKEFGPLTGMNILEIGGGYGGQALTIMDVYNTGSYDMLDLPEVLDLQRRYLNNVLITNKTKYYSSIQFKKYDLVISNYAVSEIANNEKYIEQFKLCKHGYITCNTDLVNLPFEHKKIKDVKGERDTNYILIW
jgi:putative sugar O-methyltransferase